MQGEQSLQQAQARLEKTLFLPTWRGRILDRNGIVIAEDVASYAVAIDWDVITGDRAIAYAEQDARAALGHERWKSISSEEREAIVDGYLPARLEELEQFWQVISTASGEPRGDIELRLEMIRAEVEHTAQVVWAAQEKAHRKEYGDAVQFDPRPIREQTQPHVVLPMVSDDVGIAFELLSEQYNGVIHVEHARQRSYPNRTQEVIVDQSTLPKPMRKYNAISVELDDVADLIVGEVREDVWAEDIVSKPFRTSEGIDLAGYRIGDEVGKRGLEYSLEKQLRGKRGKVVLNRKNEELSRVPVEGGQDVRMTLDIKLQARIEAVLSRELGLMEVKDWHRNAKLAVGSPLRGAVVVLDVETSEILAMASTPALRDEEDAYGYPWLNRAANGLYPPGSIIKPLVLAAAISDGVLQQNESIDCAGHYFEHVKDSARCWIYRDQYKFRTHGLLQPVEAIARSCNIFFYELGTRLGFERLLFWLQQFGMSKPISALMTNKSARGTQGHIPSLVDIEELKNRGAIAFETVSIAIGQGALTWSPLHAASAYATLARGGGWKSPSLVNGMSEEEVSIGLDPEGVSLALAGLKDSVSQRYGTGSRLRFNADYEEPTFNASGIELWGKTGTAEAPAYKLHANSEPITGLDHSWFLVMAAPKGEEQPQIVVAVLVEHGGSGGRVAGPIANQILHALRSEGYLELTE